MKNIPATFVFGINKISYIPMKIENLAPNFKTYTYNGCLSGSC